MMKESLYSARAYKKALFFILINLFFSVSISSSDLSIDESCRNSSEVYGPNYSGLDINNSLDLAKSCIDTLSEIIELKLEVSEFNEEFLNHYMNDKRYRYLLYNSYLVRCFYNKNQNNELCSEYVNFFISAANKGDDIFLSHDRHRYETCASRLLWQVGPRSGGW